MPRTIPITCNNQIKLPLSHHHRRRQEDQHRMIVTIVIVLPPIKVVVCNSLELEMHCPEEKVSEDSNSNSRLATVIAETGAGTEEDRVFILISRNWRTRR